LKASDIASRSLITVSSDASVLEAARRMVQDNVGLLVVCDPKNSERLLGVISERDIIRAVASGHALPSKVHTIATRNPITVDVNSDVAEAAKAMNQNGIRHVIVVDGSNTPKGVISMRDLVGERATLSAILQSNEKEIFVGSD
jgi:CBS domain-containing protein